MGVLGQLSYPCDVKATDWSRTSNRPITSGELFPLSYCGDEKQWAGLEPAYPVWKTGTLPVELPLHCPITHAPAGD